jgi:hypothetical protein
MKLFISIVVLVLTLLVTVELWKFMHTSTIIVTCNNGFMKEGNSLRVDNDSIVSKHPQSVYKIPDGVTCVKSYKEIER